MCRCVLMFSIVIADLLACAPPPPPGSTPYEWERSYWVIRRIRGWEVSHRATLHFRGNGTYVVGVYGRAWAGEYWATLNSVAPGHGLRLSVPETPWFVLNPLPGATRVTTATMWRRPTWELWLRCRGTLRMAEIWFCLGATEMKSSPSGRSTELRQSLTDHSIEASTPSPNPG